MGVIRVLLFPCGSGVAEELFEGLHLLRDVELVGATSKSAEGDHGPCLYNEYITDVPLIREGEKCFQTLRAIVRDRRIDVVFPCYDDAIPYLAARRDSLGCALSAPSLETCLVTRSKRLTYERLAPLGVRCPAVYEAGAAVYPCFVKPERGQGSQSSVACGDAAALTEAMRACADPLVCELLPGEEYTVDCASDRDRGLVWYGARRRVRVRAGQSVCTEWCDFQGTPDGDTVKRYATLISDAFGMRGGWFFQLKRNAAGELALLEVAPRLAGAAGLARCLGANLAQLTLLEIRRDAAWSVMTNITCYAPRLRMDKAYATMLVPDAAAGGATPGAAYDTVVVDLDDTLVLGRGAGQRVNVALVAFLFQARNAGKKLVLVTRSASDVSVVLARHALTELWAEIHHLRGGEPKSAHVPPTAIFVDDSFAERREVAAATGVPTFDATMVDALVDRRLWRAAPATSDSPEACPTRYEVRDCLTDTRATGVTVAAIDVVLLDALRARVALHLDDLAARLLAAPGAALDVAPEIWAGLRGALRRASAPAVVVDDIHTLDVDPRSGATIVADLCADNSESIAGGAYRYIACTEVLEHTAAPWAAVVELARLLAPGGLLYLSVPYNFRIHGPLPDAWRINEHGLRHLARHAGLELVELSALETPGRPLHPVHYTVVLAKDPS